MAENITIVIRAQAAQAVKEFDRVSRDLTGAADRMRSVGTSLTIGLTLPLAAVGLAATRMGTQFDEAITRVETLVGVAAERVAEFRSQILALGPEVGRGPRELARALFVVTSAGERGAGAMRVVEQAAKASAIGLGDTATVARTVTAAMQAFRKQGLSAAEATAILVETVREGNLDAASLAGSLGRVLSIAAEMGVTFAEVGSFIATFTRLGVNAEEAVTSLRATLTAALKPAKFSEAALAEVGLSAEALRRAIREDGLTAALIDLVKRFEGNEDAIVQVIPNVRALTGVLGTASAQGDEFAKIAESITGDVEGFEAAFRRVGDTPAQTFRELRAEAETIAVTFGEGIAPALSSVLGGLRPLLGVVEGSARAFAGLNEHARRFIVVSGLIVVAAGPLVLALSGIVRALALVQGALAALGVAGVSLSGALGPAGLLIGGLGLLATVLATIRDHASDAADALRGIGTAGADLDLGAQIERVKREMEEVQDRAERFSRAAQAAAGTNLGDSFGRQLGRALTRLGELQNQLRELEAGVRESQTIGGLTVTTFRGLRDAGARTAFPSGVPLPGKISVPSVAATGVSSGSRLAAAALDAADAARAAELGIPAEELDALRATAARLGVTVEEAAAAFGFLTDETSEWQGVAIAGMGSLVEATVSGFGQIEVTAVRAFTSIAQSLAQRGGPLGSLFGVVGLGVPIFGAIGGVLAAALSRRGQSQRVEIDRYSPTALSQQRDVYEERPQHVTIQLLDAQGNVTRTMKQIRRRESLDAVTRI